MKFLVTEKTESSALLPIPVGTHALSASTAGGWNGLTIQSVKDHLKTRSTRKEQQNRMVKNYTSQVPAARSVQHIEDRLVKHGAKNILKLYESHKLVGVAFIVSINGTDMPFRLPARVSRVETQLRGSVRRPRAGTMDRIADQAERTAWRLLADWIDVQMSLVELDQVELIEVFMPYIYDHQKQQTFFERWKATGFTMLEDRSEKAKKT